jgi:hypothetical protein
MTIYSFDGILRQRRRLHSVETFSRSKIALWRPVPLVGIGYFIVVAVAVAAFYKVVPVDELLTASLSAISGGDAGVASWICCYVAVPTAIVWLAMNSEIDGRAPHRWAFSCLRFLVKDKHTFCGQRVRRHGAHVRYRGRIRFFWDVDAPRLHHGWVVAGRVYTRARVHFGHALRHRHPTMTASQAGHEVTGYEVSDRLEVRP